MLKDMAASLKERAGMVAVDEDDESGRREQLLRQSEQAEQFYGIVDSLLASLPVADEDGRISLRELTSSLSEILSRLARVKDEIDAAALKGLVEGLVQAGRIASFSLEVDDALERVENLLNGFRVGSSGPRPGHLHLVSNEVKRLIARSGGKVLHLTTNFRSVQAIGDWVNPLFKSLFPAEATSCQAAFASLDTVRDDGTGKACGVRTISIPKVNGNNQAGIAQIDAGRIARWIRWAIDGGISLARTSNSRRRRLFEIRRNG